MPENYTERPLRLIDFLLCIFNFYVADIHEKIKYLLLNAPYIYIIYHIIPELTQNSASVCN